MKLVWHRLPVSSTSGPALAGFSFHLDSMNAMLRAGDSPRGLFPAAHDPYPRHRGVARTPVHPGRFLESRFMQPAGISQEALARALGISRRRVNELVRGRRAFTPDTALRLGLYFRTDPHLWLVMQAAWDVHQLWRQMGAGAHRGSHGKAR
jgi:addiction module HigA family antidote